MPLIRVQRAARNTVHMEETKSVVGATTTPVALARQVALQITGTATSITVQVERSTRNALADNAQPNWAPVDSAVTGNPSAGIQVRGFYEPASAWWRARITDIAGGSATIVLSGEEGV